MTQSIVQIGDKILSQKSLSVQKGDLIQPLITDMFDTLYAKHGIGLAAVQIGILKRIFVVDIPEISGPRVFINPIIKKHSHDLIEYEEGCLSIPEIKAMVSRPRSIELTFYDEDFQEKREVFSELFSVCIQHEIDHLDGILFLERLKKPEVRQTIKQMKKIFPEKNFSNIDLGSKPFFKDLTIN